MSAKVVLECTADGWTWSFFRDGELVGSQTMKRDSRGGWRSTAKAVVFERAMAEHQDVLEAIESESASDISQALEEIE
jgi:hypothetical protein